MGNQKEENAEKRTVLEAFVARNHTPETRNVHVVGMGFFFFKLTNGYKNTFICMCMRTCVYLMLVFLK